jgi:hypothetical protein
VWGTASSGESETAVILWSAAVVILRSAAVVILRSAATKDLLLQD